MSSLHDSQRPILLSAVRGLIRAARTERALLPEGSPERHFYLGVDAAAQEVLYPELTSSRDRAWLHREQPAFREGYLEASVLISTAATAPEPPLRIALPSPSLAG